MTLGEDDLIYCSATAYRRPFLEKVEAAAAAGFGGISLLTSDYVSARSAGHSDRDLVAAVRASGLSVGEVSSVTRWLESNGGDDEEEALVLRLVRLFDASGFNCTPLNAPFADVDAAAAAFARVCDRAAREGARCQIEFFPWTRLGDLATAWEIVRRAGRPNGGIMFDTWHHFRSGGTPDDLMKVPPEAIFGVQLADAPAIPVVDDLRAETSHRLLPGEGAAEISRSIRTLDAMGVRVAYGGEAINEMWSKLPASESARALHRSLVDVLQHARSNG